MAKRRKKEKPPRISDQEKEQVRIRTKLDHGFALSMDAWGRPRIGKGVAVLDESKTGVIRARTFDPLVSISGLSNRQFEAGKKYREEYDVRAQSGAKPASLAVKVDGGGTYKDIPAAILDAHAAIEAAHDAIGHPQIVAVVEKVCGLRMSFREIAEREERMTPRPALSILLGIGLDKLAQHYFDAKPERKRA